MKKFKVSKRNKIFIFILTSVFAVTAVLAVSFFAVYANRSRYLSPEVAKLYKDSTFTELIDQIMKTDSYEEGDLQVYAALADKLADADADTFAQLIESNKSYPRLQSAFIYTAEDQGVEIPRETLEKLIFDQSVDSDVRIDLLSYCAERGEKYSDIIEKMVSDEELTSFAIRDLYQIDKAKAAALSEQIINSFNGKYSMQLQGALHIKVFELNESSTSEEKIAFIHFCDQLIIGDCRDNEVNRNMLFNFIASIDCWESLDYLIDNEQYELRPLLAKGHFNTIHEILTGAPDAKKIDVALRAILEGVIPDFLQDLSYNVENNAPFYSEHPELYELAKKTLDAVKEEERQISLNQQNAVYD